SSSFPPRRSSDRRRSPHTCISILPTPCCALHDSPTTAPASRSISSTCTAVSTIFNFVCASSVNGRCNEVPIMNTIYRDVDVLVIGGGTAGPMAAVKAKQANPNLKVLLLEKANVKRSGAISMGMDGLNNAVVRGHATPEQYVREITAANDGIVNQKTVLAYAQNSFAM